MSAFTSFSVNSRLLLPVLLAGLAFSVSAHGSSLIWTSGHGDIGVAHGEHDHDHDHDHDHGHGELSIMDDDHEHELEFGLHYHLHDDSNLGEGDHEPGEIIMRLPGSLRTTVGADPMLGTSGPNSYLWILPATEQAGVPFVGISTEGLHEEDIDGDINFSLDSVVSPSGNGHFSLWQDDPLGNPTYYFSTNSPAGTANNNILSLHPGVHGHYNFGFTEAGLWQITLTASGTHLEEGALSDTATFTFEVIPEPNSVTLLGMAGLILLMTRRFRSRSR